MSSFFSYSFSLISYKDLNRREFALFSTLILILILMGIAPHFFLDTMYIDCVNILEHAKGSRIL